MTKKNYQSAESILKKSNWKNKALALLQITLKGLVLRGLCAKYFQPRKTKPMLYDEVILTRQ